jgi:ATP phosphoribosyltransferase regulatory subunit
MSTRASSRVGPNGQAEALLLRFEEAGYARAEPAILQPAEPFLDLSGEDIRRRMYLTTDAAGSEFCLRPDLTIPVARDYLASPQAGAAAGYCYLGPVFRFRGDAPAEFWQAGIESFGRRDIAAADAEMLALAVEATVHYGLAQPEIRLGDVGLFAALIAAVDLPAAWKRRLVKDFNRAESMEQDLDRLLIDASTNSEYQGVLAALAGADRKAAHALVTDLLSIAGISTVGGRTVADIAERLLDQAALGPSKRLPREIRTLISRFLAVAGDPDEAAGALRVLAADAGLDLEAALDLFESRTGFLAARGFDITRLRFSTGFGRGVDYYTGVVFELHDPEKPGRNLVAGGRYDGMLGRLGSAEAIPAVGFAVWIERLMARGGPA